MSLDLPQENSVNEEKTPSLCTHCDEEIIIPIYNTEDKEHSKPFCCQGCLTVFNVIHQKGLNDYYDIKNNSSIYKRRAPVELKSEKFAYLDNQDFLKEYSYKNDEKLFTMEFYLEGIHCLACLWLVEKLPEFLSDVKYSRLDMGRSVATITINPNGKFSAVARELNNLGYRPHPLKRNEEIEKFRKKEERSMLLKIGIAGFGAGNIMLFADFLYAGASGAYADYFANFIIALALPVILYSAQPFYINAWSSLKKKNLSIDIPIAFSLIVGLFMGIYNLYHGIHKYYLDTLTDLVFFVLLSRYFLQKIQEQGLKANDLNFFYQSTSVQIKNEQGSFVETHPKYLKENDIIKIKALDIIPADGIIVDGQTTLNNSLLTGESLPLKAKVNDHVFSGTQNLSQDIIVKVLKTDSETRLGNILKKVEDGWIQKSKIVDITNQVSKYFIIAIFVLAAFLGLWLFSQGKTDVAFERALTLLIVTCPCALALATPLALTTTLSRAAKKGLIIKNDLIIEKLSQVKNVFLDKTGTITYGKLKIQNFKIVNTSKVPLQDIIFTLEKNSQHPVAKALKEFAASLGPISIHQIEEHNELLGIGVEGRINGNFYEIKTNAIYENNELLANFELKDQVRSDSKTSINILKSMGINSQIISGDQIEIVNNVASEIGINKEDAFGAISPEDKLKMIDNSANSIMIGDGANDAMALSKAFVGVAVHGSMDISLRAADVYLTTPGIKPIVDLVIISKETMKVIYRNLFISLIYNLFTVVAAFMGLITPLAAAIIMPLSSVTVLLSTLIGTKKLNERLKVK